MKLKFSLPLSIRPLYYMLCWNRNFYITLVFLIFLPFLTIDFWQYYIPRISVKLFLLFHYKHYNEKKIIKPLWTTNKITKKMERGNKYRNSELGSDIQNSFLLYKKQSIYCFSLPFLTIDFWQYYIPRISVKLFLLFHYKHYNVGSLLIYI
jgi:sterol desaturase/sphingolipid hydroxylase (fatty acid hydroxylase superfamily)